jgi:diaminopimelate epimerase
MRFGKGHGTQNDFVILPDPGGALDLRPGLVARLCDRRAGIGGDGVLRVVRTAALPPGTVAPVPPAPARGATPPAEWFMDYRNADGSMAEMCGNGIRVFARYLLGHGLAAGPEIPIATSAGTRVVREEPDGQLTVDMGAPAVLGRGWALAGGFSCDGLRISLGNPHLACVVDVPLDKLDLSGPPSVDPALFPQGANVEFVRVTGGRRAEMRVHERGSGETRSCGTGAVAAAVAAAEAAGERGGTWQVRVPGGELTVTLDGATSLLTGPAVIVAEGELSPAWLAGLPSPAPAPAVAATPPRRAGGTWDSGELHPGSQEHVTAAFHLTMVLCQLLVNVDQRAALAPRERQAGVFGSCRTTRRGRRFEVPDVGLELPPGLPGPFHEIRNGPGGPELRVPVALDTPPRDDVAAPPLHHAEAVGEDGIRGVGARHVGPAVREVVAEPGHDADHALQGFADVEEIVISRDHPYILVGASGR